MSGGQDQIERLRVVGSTIKVYADNPERAKIIFRTSSDSKKKSSDSDPPRPKKKSSKKSRDDECEEVDEVEEDDDEDFEEDLTAEELKECGPIRQTDLDGLFSDDEDEDELDRRLKDEGEGDYENDDLFVDDGPNVEGEARKELDRLDREIYKHRVAKRLGKDKDSDEMKEAFGMLMSDSSDDEDFDPNAKNGSDENGEGEEGEEEEEDTDEDEEHNAESPLDDDSEDDFTFTKKDLLKRAKVEDILFEPEKEQDEPANEPSSQKESKMEMDIENAFNMELDMEIEQERRDEEVMEKERKKQREHLKRKSEREKEISNGSGEYEIVGKNCLDFSSPFFTFGLIISKKRGQKFWEIEEIESVSLRGKVSIQKLKEIAWKTRYFSNGTADQKKICSKAISKGFENYKKKTGMKDETRDLSQSVVGYISQPFNYIFKNVFEILGLRNGNAVEFDPCDYFKNMNYFEFSFRDCLNFQPPLERIPIDEFGNMCFKFRPRKKYWDMHASLSDDYRAAVEAGELWHELNSKSDLFGSRELKEPAPDAWDPELLAFFKNRPNEVNMTLTPSGCYKISKVETDNQEQNLIDNLKKFERIYVNQMESLVGSSGHISNLKKIPREMTKGMPALFISSVDRLKHLYLNSLNYVTVYTKKEILDPNLFQSLRNYTAFVILDAHALTVGMMNDIVQRITSANNAKRLVVCGSKFSLPSDIGQIFRDLLYADPVSSSYIKTIFDDSICQDMVHGVYPTFDKCLSFIKAAKHVVVVKNAEKRRSLTNTFGKTKILTCFEVHAEDQPSEYTIIDIEGMKPAECFRILYWAGWDEKRVFIKGSNDDFQNLVTDVHKIFQKGNFKLSLETALSSYASLDLP